MKAEKDETGSKSKKKTFTHGFPSEWRSLWDMNVDLVALMIDLEAILRDECENKNNERGQS